MLHCNRTLTTNVNDSFYLSFHYFSFLHSQNDGKNKITYGHGGNTAREKELFSILDLTSTSDWETPGSPQNQALYWLANDDRVALSLDNDEEIKERFAAATLYFATDGPESWKTSLGFLGANSICNWNDDNGEGLNGIFCQDGRVNEINIGKDYALYVTKYQKSKCSKNLMFWLSILCQFEYIINYHIHHSREQSQGYFAK